MKEILLLADAAVVALLGFLETVGYALSCFSSGHAVP